MSCDRRLFGCSAARTRAREVRGVMRLFCASVSTTRGGSLSRVAQTTQASWLTIPEQTSPPRRPSSPGEGRSTLASLPQPAPPRRTACEKNRHVSGHPRGVQGKGTILSDGKHRSTDLAFHRTFPETVHVLTAVIVLKIVDVVLLGSALLFRPETLAGTPETQNKNQPANSIRSFIHLWPRPHSLLGRKRLLVFPGAKASAVSIVDATPLSARTLVSGPAAPASLNPAPEGASSPLAAWCRPSPAPDPSSSPSE